MKKLTMTCCAVLAVFSTWLLGSCAEGYETSSISDLGVRNTQMETPIQDSISFKVSTDGKTATVTIDTSGKLKSGTNRLRITVTDGAGNTTDVTWTVTK